MLSQEPRLTRALPTPSPAAPHRLHLLGTPGLTAADGIGTGPVCGARGAPGVQPAAAVPAGHRQRPARGQGCQQADPTPPPLLLPLHCLHPHHQGEAPRPRLLLLLLPPSPCLPAPEGLGGGGVGSGRWARVCKQSTSQAVPRVRRDHPSCGLPLASVSKGDWSWVMDVSLLWQW